jgi:hypothetical protein
LFSNAIDFLLFFLVFCQLLLRFSSSIAGKRGVRAPFTWARQNEFRLASVALLAYIA